MNDYVWLCIGVSGYALLTRPTWLKKPEDYLTRLQGSKLWHLAALELWWQQSIEKQ